MKKVISVIMAILIVISATFALTGAMASEKIMPTMKISADKISYAISDRLYGINLENEGNAIDGGLVSNLINNNSFEFAEDVDASWSINTKSHEILSENGMNENNSNYLSVTVEEQGTVENIGYTEFYNYKSYQINNKTAKSGDMGFKANATYSFSAFFKNVDYEGTLTLSLSANGNKEKYQFNLDSCEDWTKITLQIKSDVTADGSMLLTCDGTGTFYMDYVTLTPENSYGYGSEKWTYASLRNDLVNSMKDLSPAYIRFAAGELDTAETVEDLGSWKDTLGLPETRKQSYTQSGKNITYVNSNLMGMYEYLLLCEEVGAEAIPTINAGIVASSKDEYTENANKYANGAITEENWKEYLDEISLNPESEAFAQYVQDVLDMIEYANGDDTTPWGQKRIEDGHAEPFGLKYIAIGNGDFGDVYWQNFDAIYKAIKEKYPEIIVVICCVGELSKDDYKKAVETVNSLYPDVILAENNCTNGGSLYKSLYKYDNYGRTGAKIAVSEYGINTTVGDTLTKNNIWSAIENAVFLMSLERNSDLAQMSAYQTLLSKINAQTSDTSAVWFSSNDVIYTPDYYMQMMFANNMGTNYISSDFNMEEDGIYHSITVDTEQKVIYVKIANSTRRTQRININIEGFNNVKTPSVQYMSENFKSACNEPGQQLHVAPVEAKLKIDNNTIPYDVDKYSISVIRIPYDTNNGSSVYELPTMDIISPYIPTNVGMIISGSVLATAFITGAVILLVRINHHRKVLNVMKKETEKTE